jgi:Rad3-related DNA helicase
MKMINSLKNLSKKIGVFIKSVNKNQFIIEPIGEGAGLTIQPLKVETLFTEYMNPWAMKKVIFMSATILNVKLFCEELGISREDVDIIRVGSAFDPKKSPIYYVPAGKMNYKSLSSTMPNIIKYVDKIIDKHYMDKGIIHTGNYQIATDIKSNSKYADRLLLRSGYETNEDLIKRHCNSPEPTILLSPSLSTGTDLRDDLSRFQIVVKMPFASLADKRVKIKSDLNPEWYACEMLRTLIQSCGRSTRSEDDYSSTYILDSSLYYWLRKYHNLIPSQFKDRIVWPKN